ncbi:MAG TPA: sulfatase-like hydrolase/transferase [Candidatus Limnocylindrales bacterium]|nr:sulfatase-like hydrolase/transferase [Candidatus Limnocylindrales bacterium]
MAVDPPPGAERPNIIVFYIDDAAPHDGRLWNNPTRTPNIVEHFYDNGFEFNNAIVENPLCCPARGNFLTGLHTHNNGVVGNDARLFDPSVHLGRSLKDAGYATMFIGKYLNNNAQLTDAEWQEHDSGWTQLDVFKGVNGYFNNYTLHTKTGDLEIGKYHSTQMVADRTIMHLRETPAEQPVFAVLSIYNLHGPNTPMAQFKGDPRCANMPPWLPDNYNEADVSDKPLEIQALPSLLDPTGWPMVRYCEELLGIDKAVGEVTAELEADGRLDNTLLVFTADNGIAWGAHRLGQQKIYPYATPVPLFMSWPDRWGDLETVNEHVSNIDLAPTFCELAQSCEMTDYPRGQTAPDGVSLVPLLDGEVSNLGRDAVLEESYEPTRNYWTALRTTAIHPRGLWHYVEYETGERELYDLATDPDELNNLANVPGHDEILAEFALRLSALRAEGTTDERGTIRFVQSTVPHDGQDFNYSGDLGSFTLDDDLDTVNRQQRTFANIPTGTYTMTQTAVPGWTLTEIACTEEVVSDVTTGTATIDLHPNQVVVCTFVNAAEQPDAGISQVALGPFKVDGVYASTALESQTSRRKNAKRRGVYDFYVMIQNDGGQTDSFKVRGLNTGSTRISVAFLDPSVVTSQVTAGTYTVSNLAPGATAFLGIRFTVGSRAGSSAKKTVDLTVSSVLDPTRVDVVRAVTRR